MVKSSIRVDTVSNPPHAVMLIWGEIDAATGMRLAAEVESLPPSITSVELDMTEVGFVDSTGLGVIAGLINRLQPRGGRVSLRNPSDLTIRLLTITDLLQFVTVVDERA